MVITEIETDTEAETRQRYNLQYFQNLKWKQTSFKAPQCLQMLETLGCKSKKIFKLFILLCKD